MNKEPNQEPIKSDINQHILNIITPAGIDFTDTLANIGENYGKMYCVSRYPSSGVDYGWLAALCNMEGTATTVEYRPTSAASLVDAMNKQIMELNAELNLAKKESDKQIKERQIKDIQDMIQRISINEEPVGYLNIMLHIQDTDKKSLDNRVKRVSARTQAENCTLMLLRYKQKKALGSCAPYGVPNPVVSNIGQRIMPMSTFLGGFPMANSGINDVGGYFLGKTFKNKVVILNMWIRGKDRTNSNWFIAGTPGTGKSTVMKSIFTKELAFGTKIIILDPEEEYTELAKDKDINGDIIDCMNGSIGRINPLQVRISPRVTKEDFEPGESLEDFFQYEENLGVSDLALHIQNLRVFFRLYFGEKEYDAGIKTTLEECLIEIYERHNITWDTDIKKLSPEDFPIVSELYTLVEEKLVKKGLSEYRKNIYDRLRDLLYPIGKGADRFLWDGVTNIKTNSKFVVLNASRLLETDDNVKRAQFMNILTWMWGEMSADRTERVLAGTDEGYLFIDPEMIEVMKFFRNISKRSRKYESGLLFITHDVGDLLDESIKRYGQAIVSNSCFKLILGTDGKNLEETKKLLKLTDSEESILLAKNRGEGILFAGNVRVSIKVEVAEALLHKFGKAGGR